jgi:hypothetical protein
MTYASTPTPSASVVRPACPEDNEALLALVRRCPMEANISLIVERDPDFFALSRARGEARTFVAEIDNTIVGCLSSWRSSAWLSGRPATVCYIGDMRVAPEVRRRGVGLQLATINLEHLNALSDVPHLAAIGAGNAAVAPLVAAFGGGGPPVATFTSFQLLPVLRFKIATPLEIGTAEPRDERELVTLLDDFYQHRDFAPVFGGGGLAKLLDRSPGMQLSDYFLARRNGKIVATIGLWDASSLKRTRVVGMPVWLRGLCTIGRGLSRIAPIPPFPQPGRLLHFRYIRHAAYLRGEEEALGNLVRWAVNAARTRGEHFVLYTCATGDSLSTAIVGVPRLSFHYRVASSNLRQEPPSYSGNAESRSGYFDDAALS